jgi:hypothetical protein
VIVGGFEVRRRMRSLRLGRLEAAEYYNSTGIGEKWVA